MIIKSPAGKLNILHAPDTDIMNALKLGFYEPHVQQWIFDFAHGKCLDIGSNVGIHSILMSKMGCEVHCIEGNPEAIELMKINYKANYLSLPTIHNVFLGNGSHVSFVEISGRMGSSYTTNLLNGHIVNTYSLRDTIDFQPDFIKMDIEGAELCVIEESPTLFSNAILVIELNKLATNEHYGYPINALISKLYELYTTVKTKDGPITEDKLKEKMESTIIVDVICYND